MAVSNGAVEPILLNCVAATTRYGKPKHIALLRSNVPRISFRTVIMPEVQLKDDVKRYFKMRVDCVFKKVLNSVATETEVLCPIQNRTRINMAKS